jgi:hypothetical protein
MLLGIFSSLRGAALGARVNGNSVWAPSAVSEFLYFSQRMRQGRVTVVGRAAVRLNDRSVR